MGFKSIEVIRTFLFTDTDKCSIQLLRQMRETSEHEMELHSPLMYARHLELMKGSLGGKYNIDGILDL